MKRKFLVYLGICVVSVERLFRRACSWLGEMLKRLGRRLCAFQKEDQRWTLETLLHCYMTDIEFHIGTKVYRGPLYGAHKSIRSEDMLVFKLNWTASRFFMDTTWNYAGTSDFRIRAPRAPVALPNGDVWFGFPGGYGIIFLGKQTVSLPFDGGESPRIYRYF